MKQQILLVTLLLLLPVTYLIGQEFSEKNFDHYTTASGMSDDYVSGLAQDSAGHVWIATSSGLNRYNGSRFIQFHSTQDSLSLPSESIGGITWLSKNRLGIFPLGVHVVNTRTGETRNIFIPCRNRQYQYKYNAIMRVFGDEVGNTYILSRSGFYHFDKDDKLVFRFDYYREDQVQTTHFFFGEHMVQLDSNRLMILSRESLYIYNKEKRKFRKMRADDCPLMVEFLRYPATAYLFLQRKPGELFIFNPENDSLTYVNIFQNKKVVSHLPINPIRNEFRWRSRLIPASDTVLYVTSHFSGFYKMRFYPETGEVKMYPQKYFPSYLCTSLLKDKDNNLWIGTNKGLFRQNSTKSLVEVANLSAGMVDSFPNIRLADIYVAADKIYAGGLAGGGLLIFNKEKFRLERQVLFDTGDFRTAHINAIVPASRSTLFLCTAGPMFLFDEVSEKSKMVLPPKWDLTSQWANDLLKDREGNIWISSDNIYIYNPTSKKFIVKPLHQPLLSVTFGFEEDRKGNIWMGGHGLTRYNIALDSFDLVIDSFPFIKIPDRQVNAFVIDYQNTLWFSTVNNGLIAYNIDRRSFRHFTTSDGLPDNNIVTLKIIGNKLWIASLSGVACMDLSNSTIVSFGKEDGFPAMPIAKGTRFFYDSTAQQLYLCFSNAIARFNPFDILRKKSPPKLFVESVVIGAEKNVFLPGTRLTTSWRDNQLMMTIGSINFSDGNSQGFAYRIVKEGRETPWQQLGSQPSFSISNLSPGTHRIQIKCFSLTNRWPEQIKEITISVLPPFWKTDWFLLSIIGVSLVLLYLLIQWRTGMARKKEMEKTQIEKLKADDYKNQFELEQISNYFSSSLAGKKTEEEVLWDVTNNLIGRMNYVDCMIYLWNADKTRMVQKAAYGPKGKPEIITEQVFEVLPGQGIVGHAIVTRQPVLVNDTRQDSRYRVDDEFRLSEVCVPIIHNDELLGILDSEHYLPNFFSDRDIKILGTIATLIGNKLKQIESEQSLEEKHKELANINEQLAEARLAALQSQMNPHFVFNALNSIKRMILDGDNEKASRYLSKFALMIRMTLNQSRDIFVTVDDNVEYLRAYLEMEQLRFGESFSYDIFTDGRIDAGETNFPSLMIQPLVENAIWHGLMQAGDDKRVAVRFMQCEGKIVCTIEDNGIGIRESEKLKKINGSVHRSHGLENLQRRIKIMNEKYDTDCSLEIVDLKEIDSERTGTRVTLQLNIINT
jgi:ligand-binding sensor domain-containing protein/putative methionine-R-sulfoxide reductase with GAF domain